MRFVFHGLHSPRILSGRFISPISRLFNRQPVFVDDGKKSVLLRDHINKEISHRDLTEGQWTVLAVHESEKLQPHVLQHSLYREPHEDREPVSTHHHWPRSA